MKNTILTMIVLLCFAGVIWADDVDVNLNSKNGSTGFVVKNNNTTPDSLLKVKSNGDIGLKTGNYLNYGSTYGNAGYGFRDNIGTLEYKNSGGAWLPFGRYSSNGYINFGTPTGSTGYGIRDNSGTVEFKNSAGSWSAITTAPTTPYGFGSGTYSFGQIAYNHGNYGTTQPSVEIGAAAAYETMLPAILGSGGGTPWETIANGDVSIAEISGKPAYLKINATGLYRISATVAIKGTANTSIEVEIFRQNSISVPATNSWITLTHDLEAISTALSVTNGQYDAGSITGMYELSANDYIALCSRVLSGSANTQKVICINLNVERIK